ncbi:MAG: ribbon-helix-helix domain-containing protein [Candidatus Limnocylindrales bacterium]
MARTNLTLPEELMHQVDELAGPRGRSAFVADAVAYKVKRERLRRALDVAEGSLIGTSMEMTPEESYAWIRAMRKEGNESGR